MNLSISVAAAVSLFFSANVMAEEPSWSFPDPAEYGAHLTELCKPETSSALFIAALRDKGMTKAEVSARLPQGTPERLRLTHVVRENLDDLYSFPTVAGISYYAFRGTSCVREKAEGKTVIQFSSLSTGVIGCQEKHGLQARSELASCIRELMK